MPQTLGMLKVKLSGLATSGLECLLEGVSETLDLRTSGEVKCWAPPGRNSSVQQPLLAHPVHPGDGTSIGANRTDRCTSSRKSRSGGGKRPGRAIGA